MQTIKQLCDEFQEFCQTNNLPMFSADELLCEESIMLTDEQKQYLKNFINVWELAEQHEEENSNKRFCEICDTAHIVTTEEVENLFYCCPVCRGFETENGVEVRENIFDETKVIEYTN